MGMKSWDSRTRAMEGKEEGKLALSIRRCVAAITGNNRAKCRIVRMAFHGYMTNGWNGMGYLHSMGFINRHLTTIATSDTGMCDGMDEWMDGIASLSWIYPRAYYFFPFFPLGVRICFADGMIRNFLISRERKGKCGCELGR